MITKLLTIFTPWPYAGNASAKSEAGFGSLIHKRMYAAMRHFLCPKKSFCPFVQWADMCGRLRPAGTCDRSSNLHLSAHHSRKVCDGFLRNRQKEQ